ncbi:MAG: hypothetical protein N2312_03225 [Dictyoglomaceae bacterium]|nr:hypothetical protein [Dictyoglomaceae bacterium]
MKKVLISYYSRTGFTEKLAKRLKEELNCDIEEIIDKVNTSFISCLFSSFLRRNTIIEPIKKDPKDYDFVIICSPIWAGALSPAIRTYIHQNKEKFENFAIISVSKWGERNKDLRFEVGRILGKNPSYSIMLSEKEIINNSFLPKLKSLLDYIKQN